MLEIITTNIFRRISCLYKTHPLKTQQANLMYISTLNTLILLLIQSLHTEILEVKKCLYHQHHLQTINTRELCTKQEIKLEVHTSNK